MDPGGTSSATNDKEFIFECPSCGTPTVTRTDKDAQGKWLYEWNGATCNPESSDQANLNYSADVNDPIKQCYKSDKCMACWSCIDQYGHTINCETKVAGCD